MTVVAGVIATLLAASPIVAQSETRWTGRFEATGDGAPPTLEIDAPNLTVSIVGHSGDSIEFLTHAPPDASAVPTPVLQGRRLLFVDLDNPIPMSVEVLVPHRTRVRVRTSNRGLVSVTDIHAEVDVENSNAPIEMSGMRAAVLASTSNGTLTVRFDSVPDEGTTSLLGSNAAVTVYLPPDAGAHVVLETDGNVESDFPLERIANSRRRGRTLDRTIGGGGSFIRIRTDNAPIRLLRGSPQ